MKIKGEMKTWVQVGLILILAVGLMILAKAASAANVSGSNALQKNSTNSGTNGLGIQLTTGADFNGNTGVGLLVNCPTCAGGSSGQAITTILNIVNGTAATSYYDKLSTGAAALSNNAVVPLKVSSTVTMASRYEASATWTTATTTTYNVTSTAGTDGRYNITLRANRGGTSAIYAINASATPQATVATLDGREVITGASHKTEGPCYESGSHVHVRASGTASVVGTLILEQCK